MNSSDSSNKARFYGLQVVDSRLSSKFEAVTSKPRPRRAATVTVAIWGNVDPILCHVDFLLLFPSRCQILLLPFGRRAAHTSLERPLCNDRLHFSFE